jgi:hypothetical protein
LLDKGKYGMVLEAQGEGEANDEAVPGEALGGRRRREGLRRVVVDVTFGPIEAPRERALRGSSGGPSEGYGHHVLALLEQGRVGVVVEPDD